MSVWKSSATATQEPVEVPPRCEACRRTGVPMELSDVRDVGRVHLCPDPASCRRNWPREEG